MLCHFAMKHGIKQRPGLSERQVDVNQYPTCIACMLSCEVMLMLWCWCYYVMLMLSSDVMLMLSCDVPCNTIIGSCQWIVCAEDECCIQNSRNGQQVSCGKMQQSVPCVLQRGLAPRVFEYIFKRISEEEDNVVSTADHADCMQAAWLYM